MSSSITRRGFVCAAPLFLSACVTNDVISSAVKPIRRTREIPEYYRTMYAAIDTDTFPIPAPDLTKIDEQFYRQEVPVRGTQPAGSIVVDTQNRFLYYVLEGNRAIRYGIGVGKAGLEFEGVGVIQYKRAWPRWTPTQEMIAREPDRYGPLANGMEPGPTNPLGARALYLFKNGEDTLYRIHGTNEDWSIGKAMSSGCIRMLNQDVIDLHLRVANGTRVLVMQSGGAAV